MDSKKTTYDAFKSASKEHSRLLQQEQLILDVTERILELLDNEGVTQSDLAERLGKSRSHVSQILNGRRNLTLRTLSDVGHALDHRVQLELKRKGDSSRAECRVPAKRRDIVDMSTWKRQKRKIDQRVVDRAEGAGAPDLPAAQGMRS